MIEVKRNAETCAESIVIVVVRFVIFTCFWCQDPTGYR